MTIIMITDPAGAADFEGGRGGEGAFRSSFRFGSSPSAGFRSVSYMIRFNSRHLQMIRNEVFRKVQKAVVRNLHFFGKKKNRK